MIMWVAVNKDGSEVISNEYLFRVQDGVVKLSDHIREQYSHCFYWCDSFSNGMSQLPEFNGITLPKGSIEKLFGKKLTWEDNPIKI